MGTVIVALLLFAVISISIYDMVKNKKKGKSISGCDGDCGHCNGHCH